MKTDDIKSFARTLHRDMLRTGRGVKFGGMSDRDAKRVIAEVERLRGGSHVHGRMTRAK